MTSPGQHAHAHAPEQNGFGKAFAIGVALNLVFVLVEAFYGWRTGSLALLADAAHNLSDVGGLLLAWAAFAATRLQADARHSYGWRRGSILAGFINAVILLVAMGSLAWEAMHRLQGPASFDAWTVMVVAAIGVVINSVTAWLFMAGSKGDLNIRGAFLHMAADALVSLGVVAGGGLYLWLGWAWLDPVLSLVIALVVVVGTWSLFRQSLHLMFDGVPAGIDLAAVQGSLLGLPGIVGLHELHVWALSTSEIALTVHLVCDAGDTEHDAIVRAAQAVLEQGFGIRHATLQLESPALAATCMGSTACYRQG